MRQTPTDAVSHVEGQRRASVQICRWGGDVVRLALVSDEPEETITQLLGAAGFDVGVYRTVQELTRSGAASESDQIAITEGENPSRVLEEVAAVVASGAGTPVLVVTDEVGLRRVRVLLAAGVSGVVLRETLTSALVPTIRAVAAGQICLPSQQTPALSRPVLTIREKQVIGLVALGLKNGEVAERLYLAESTVKSHLSSAFGKLGVRSRHEAIDLIVDPASGMGLGILSLEAEPLVTVPSQVASR